MQSFGIYTLANDVVIDQLIAFLNSVEANVSPDIPVCVIPYDDRLTRVQQEIALRPQVTLFDNPAAIQRWETFSQQVWKYHPQGSLKELASLVQVRIRAQRKYAAFDGEFDTFVFYDVDTLAMKPLDDLRAKLEHYDFVFDDWEHAKPDRVAALRLELIEKAAGIPAAEVRSKLHCSSFFGSKKGLLNEQAIATLQERLIDHSEIAWVCGVAEAFLFSYLTLRGEFSQFNFTLSPNNQDRTGNCADADPFVEKDHILYNEQGLKPIHRIHYMNYGAAFFSRLCQGEDVGMRYQDVFLHYRFLKNPEQRPRSLHSPNLWTQFNRSAQAWQKKLAQKMKV